MNINRAEYVWIDRRPFLRLMIDGKEALIGEFKWSLLELGYVPLHSGAVNWEELLPEIHIPANEDHDSIELRGFTNDPVVIKMARSYWKAINHLDGEKFSEGPVLIPARG